MLETPSDGSIFFHINSFGVHPIEIFKKQVIALNKIKNRDNQHYSAKNSRLLESFDLPLAMSLLDKPYLVNLTDTSRPKQGTSGTPPRDQHDDLLLLAVDQVFRGKDANIVENTFRDYFMNTLDENQIVPFCEFVERWSAHHRNDSGRAGLSHSMFSLIGDNLTPAILFHIWKRKAFRFIGKAESGDYEIPLEVVQQFFSHLGPEEFNRIRSYSYAAAFETPANT
ncbi:hypothetical protein [Parapedobacter koreensis]|nr:hypothetical protein [Parapedobacter koreensis]